MKKIMKSRFFAFMLGAIIFSGITGVAAASILASSISYSPSDNSWNVNNVESALDDLKSNCRKSVTIKNENISCGSASTQCTINSFTPGNVYVCKQNDRNQANGNISGDYELLEYQNSHSYLDGKDAELIAIKPNGTSLTFSTQSNK